jgi:hypothetical protein
MKTEMRKFIDRDAFVLKIAEMAIDDCVLCPCKDEGLGIATTALSAIIVAMEQPVVEQFVDVPDSE